MLDSVRLRERMSSLGISQAELGRRLGIHQSAVNHMVSGRNLGSRYLHLVARELSTSAAYLTGETDDPDEDAPPVPALSQDQRKLIDAFEHLPRADQVALLQIAESMAGKSSSGSVHAPSLKFHPKED